MLPGLDLNDRTVSDALRLYFQDAAPEAYKAWFDRNLSHYDPVIRCWRLKDSLPSKYQGSFSHKCCNDRCLHYIYGFASKEDRDRHAREHSAVPKRDSGVSVASTPSLPALAGQFARRPESNIEPTKHSPPLYLPRPAGPLESVNQPVPSGLRDPKDSLRSYSLASEPQVAPRDSRHSIDSEVDPLLPPLKRSRVGQSKLESIGELRLLRDHTSCVHCRITQKSVSCPCSWVVATFHKI